MTYWAAMILGSSAVFVIEAVKSLFKTDKLVGRPPSGVRFLWAKGLNR